MKEKNYQYTKEKKTVGIITIQNIENYGACLQSFALWYYINSLGYKCEIIDLLTPVHKGYKKSKNFKTYQVNISCIKKYYRLIRGIIQKIKENIIFIRNRDNISTRQKNFSKFNKQIQYSTIYKNADALYNSPPLYDIYVTGSDQVWNPTLGFELEAYFLTFAPNNVKKIAYAPSIARNDLPEQFEVKYKKWLSKYNHLSIREKSGQNIINNILGVQVPVVLDPTFLLCKEEWINQMAKNIVNQDKYILCFTLSSKELINYASDIAKEANLELLVISTYNNYKIKDANIILDAGPAELLSYIYNAQFVITDSFHGVAMSIQLANNFFAYVKPIKKNIPDISDRIRTIIEMFNLNDHVISNLDTEFKDLNRIQLNRDKLDKLINIEREKSINYLKSALKS